MSTTWLSSAKTTYVSASRTARVSLSRSGRLSGQTRRLFGADFGFGIPKCSSIPTGPSQGSSGANPWATSATSLRQLERPFAVEVITGLPFTTNARVEPCGTGRPWTWNEMRELARIPPGGGRTDRSSKDFAFSAECGARGLGVRVGMSHPHLRRPVLRSEDVDRVHVDPRAGETLRDLCEFSGPVQELEV